MTDERLKLIFGFALMVALVLLCSVIALGKVNEESSFGLREIITGLLVLTGAFAGWAFGSIRKNDE